MQALFWSALLATAAIAGCTTAGFLIYTDRIFRAWDTQTTVLDCRGLPSFDLFSAGYYFSLNVSVTAGLHGNFFSAGSVSQRALCYDEAVAAGWACPLTPQLHNVRPALLPVCNKIKTVCASDVGFAAAFDTSISGDAPGWDGSRPQRCPGGGAVGTEHDADVQQALAGFCTQLDAPVRLQAMTHLATAGSYALRAQEALHADMTTIAGGVWAGFHAQDKVWMSALERQRWLDAIRGALRDMRLTLDFIVRAHSSLLQWVAPGEASNSTLEDLHPVILRPLLRRPVWDASHLEAPFFEQQLRALPLNSWEWTGAQTFALERPYFEYLRALDLPRYDEPLLCSMQVARPLWPRAVALLALLSVSAAAVSMLLRVSLQHGGALSSVCQAPGLPRILVIVVGGQPPSAL